MNNGSAGYWAFIEKIHDLTEYVQELLRQNGRLKRQLEELEQQQQDRDAQIASLRQRLRLRREEDAPPEAPSAPSGNGASSESGVWRPSLQLSQPGVRTC